MQPALSRAHIEQIIEPATVACQERIARAQERGEMRADADRQAMIDMLYGAIYYRLLLHTRPLEPEQIDAVDGANGQPAFYRQIADYHERFLEENERRLGHTRPPLASTNEAHLCSSPEVGLDGRP